MSDHIPVPEIRVRSKSGKIENKNSKIDEYDYSSQLMEECSFLKFKKKKGLKVQSGPYAPLRI